MPAGQLLVESEHAKRLIEKNARENIVDQIYATGTIPETYREWKARIWAIDSLYLWRREDKKSMGM